MAKQSALGANLYFAEFDLSGDVGVISNISGPRGMLDITAINASATERILGLRDGNIAFSGFWNTATGQIYDVLDNMPTTDVLVTAAIPTASSFAIGDPAVGINGKQITFDQERGQDGSLGVTTEIHSNGTALEWGRLLTAGKATIGTGTVNQTAVDGAASTSFGASFYLHVMSIASGTMGVKIMDSANNTDFDDLSGGAFTNVTGATSERIALGATATVRRYVRLTTTGVHGDAVMAVLFARHQTSQAI